MLLKYNEAMFRHDLTKLKSLRAEIFSIGVPRVTSKSLSTVIVLPKFTDLIISSIVPLSDGVLGEDGTESDNFAESGR